MPRVPRPVVWLFRALLPIAEREEVVEDLQAEFDVRARAAGLPAARRWAWRQALGSAPALLRRGWWRGMTGFEPRANRMRPGGPMFESWIMDCRYAARRLSRRPGYTVLAVLTLALGAGGTAATFSIARTLLFDPLPIVREEQVGVLYFSGSWNEREFLHLRPDFAGFQQMAAYRPADATLEIPNSPMRLVAGIAASTELFDVLGTRAMIGRTFQAGEDATGAPPIAILSHALWRELGADPAIVGKPIQLGGVPRMVIGVMPPGFWFPSPETRIWTAAQMNPQNQSGRYTLVGRVADGHAVEHMDGPLRTLTGRLAASFQYPNPQWDKTTSPSIESVREFLIGDVRPSIVAALAAMGLILLIACGNVAALMLGQLDARAAEIAVRAALGANRQRMIQQLAVESMLVGALAGTAGAMLAVAGFEVLVRSLPLGALADNAALDWSVFWTSMTAALAGAIVTAIVPAAVLWRGSSLRSSIAGARTGGVGERGGRLEGTLVVAQMALAVLLATGAGLLMRSVANLQAIDPGVAVDGRVVIDAAMPTRFTPDERRRTIQAILPSLAALPGVTSAAAAQKLPLRGSGDNWGIRILGTPDLAQATTAFRMVTRDYFSTVGLPLRRGRDFGASDREGSDRVVIINEALAHKFFPGEDPIGRVLQTFDDAGERIVGVVANAAEASLTDPPQPARYMLYEHVPAVWHQTSFVLRTGSEDGTASVAAAARGVIMQAGSNMAVQNTTTMRRLLDLAIGPAGRVVTLLTILSGLALALGAIGVYGVISHYVTRRAREYGVRIALGQSPWSVVRHVTARGVLLVSAGGAIGMVAAAFATRLLGTLLYQVGPTDPVAMALAGAVLLLIGCVAAFLPARRASLTDPAVILRQ